MIENFKILDCTLRDGGYYNDWLFSESDVLTYLEAMTESNVDMVELGLRHFDSTGFKGPHYFSTEEYLAKLPLSEKTTFGVMVNAGTVLAEEGPIGETVKRLFCHSSDTPIGFVRVACHLQEIRDTKLIVETLKSLGYTVYINLMQVAQHSRNKVLREVKTIQAWGFVDGLYIADSLGNMTADGVATLISQVATVWAGALGFHAHNNMGLALQNTIASVEAGCVLIDATMAGMGRGAGNTETEALVAHLNSENVSKYKLRPLMKAAIKTFYPMKQVHSWGSNSYYYLAAKYGIHPTYVQKILTDPHFGPKEREQAAEVLPKLAHENHFCPIKLARSFSNSSDSDGVTGRSKGESNLNHFNKKLKNTALLIGGGPSSETFAQAITEFAKKKESDIFATNQGTPSLNHLVKAFFISDNIRDLDNHTRALLNSQAVIRPLSKMKSQTKLSVKGPKTIVHPLKIEDGIFRADHSAAVIPFDLTAGYALASLISLNYSKIYVAGFDGYESDDPRQKEMSELLHRVMTAYPDIQIISLTPTSYPITQKSVYAPAA